MYYSVSLMNRNVCALRMRQSAAASETEEEKKGAEDVSTQQIDVPTPYGVFLCVCACALFISKTQIDCHFVSLQQFNRNLKFKCTVSWYDKHPWLILPLYLRLRLFICANESTCICKTVEFIRKRFAKTKPTSSNAMSSIKREQEHERERAKDTKRQLNSRQHLPSFVLSIPLCVLDE